MKINLFFFVVSFSLVFNAFAQVDTVHYKRIIPYKWGFSVAVNSVDAQMDQKLFDTWVYPSANYYAYYGDKHDKSFSLSIIPKYRIAANILLRFELGLTNIDLRSHYDGIGDTATQNQGYIGGAAGIIKNDIIQQKIYRYILGVQWSFIEKKFIEGYCGATLNYFRYSKMDWSDKITMYSPAGRSTNYSSSTPGGFAAGIGGFFGINIYLNKYISLGGEISYSLLFYKLGGVQNGKTENIYPSSPSEVINWKIHNNESKGLKFSKIMPSLNFTVRF